VCHWKRGVWRRGLGATNLLPREMTQNKSGSDPSLLHPSEWKTGTRWGTRRTQDRGGPQVSSLTRCNLTNYNLTNAGWPIRRFKVALYSRPGAALDCVVGSSRI